MSDTDLTSKDIAQIDADVDAVMKKYDRESNVRIWEGRPAVIVRWLSAAFSLYCIYVTLFSTAMPEVRLNIFLGLILILGYLHYPIKKAAGEIRPGLSDSISIPITLDAVPRVNSIPFYDIVIMLAGAIPFFYFAYNAESIIKLALRVTSPRNPNYHLMIAMAVLAILSTM
ncbi:MAG: hypothetical protein IJT02_05655, partial [Synergistaceae bacterium]|nr:hypothetical protein [Synergistaceae bacterium]